MINNISVSSLNNIEKIHLYSKMDTDYLNIHAIFSDETLNFVSCYEPDINDIISIKIRTAKNNIDKVFLLKETGTKIPLTIVKNDSRKQNHDMFDYWFCQVKLLSTINYSFLIMKNNDAYYYNKKGLYKELDKDYNFKIIPGFKTPNWSKGAIMYQIYVDRFFNGDHSNDVVNNEYAYLGQAARRIENWHQSLETEDICNFYGGDLQGIIEKMNYLQQLGIDAIYLSPVFVSPSNHKYDIQDYDYIDPHYGVIISDGGAPLTFEKFNNRFATMYIQRTTVKENLEASNQLMSKLIQIAHDHGIRVILDGVFNHCGAFNKWLDKAGFYNQQGYPNGAYRDENSPYHNYFRWYDKNWPNNDCYDAWWGHDNHPKLNFEESEELYNYILEIGKKWVSPPFNADGWRLDVAADLGYSIEFNHKFWKEFRGVVKQANPEAIVFAEHYGDPLEWLQGDQWDTVMNYDAFMEPVTWFLTGMEKHSEEYRHDMFNNAMAFESAMRYHMSRFAIQSLHTAMNELSNHDHSRFLTRTNMTVGRLHTRGAKAADIGINKGIMREAVVIQMTWPGAPTIYYGDEASVTGWTDPDNRRTYPWGREDQTMIAFHIEAVKIHKAYSCLKTGSLEYLFNDYGILSYARWLEDEAVVVIVNNNSIVKTLSIPIWKVGINSSNIMKKLISTNIQGFDTQPMEYLVDSGKIEDIILEPFSSLVLAKM